MDWSTQEISTSELDAAVREMQELDMDYEAKKKISSEAHAKFEEARTKVLSMLQAAGKTKYYVEGIGTVSMAMKYSVKVPQDPNAKMEMLSYFLALGQDVYPGLLTVNHQTLNSYVKQKSEEDPEFRLPGIGERKEEPELRFRRTKE